MRVPRWTITIAVCGLSAGVGLAKDPPADLCSLLTPAQLEKAFAVPFAAPEKNQAPAPFRNIPPGTQCEYKVQKGPAIKVVFIVYADPSAAVAKQTFDRLSMWYTPKSKPKIGDAAYLDKNDAIHVLKNRVRYFIAVEGAGTAKSAPYMSWASAGSSSGSATEKAVQALAAEVAGEI